VTRRAAQIRLAALLSWLPVLAVTWLANWATGGSATSTLSTIAAAWTAVALLVLINVLETR